MSLDFWIVRCKKHYFSIAVDFREFLVQIKESSENGNTFTFNQKLESLHKMSFPYQESRQSLQKIKCFGY